MSLFSVPAAATPAVMVQGVSSDAGKSLIAAALCRILARRGKKVVPFKAQNMTSRACTLPDGALMSGAQVLQAMAAGISPDIRMNPVLLRPAPATGHSGSEVFVLGKSCGHMHAREYARYKETAFAAVRQAYASLAAEADCLVIEGAGSPAEINLQADDIVNMRMARLAGAAVLLAGDIDRGGVFAHLYGTYLLLQPEDRPRVRAFLVNKFRGDASLLAPALQQITEATGVPFGGVIPYIEGLRLPAEDSLSPAAFPEGGKLPDDPSLQDSIQGELDRLADCVEAHLQPGLLDSLLQGRAGAMESIAQ